MQFYQHPTTCLKECKESLELELYQKSFPSTCNSSESATMQFQAVRKLGQYGDGLSRHEMPKSSWLWLPPPILETKWTWSWSTTVALKCKVRNAKTKKMQRRTRCPNPRDSAGGSYFGELPPGADSHGPSTLAGTNLNRENCTFSERDPCQIANSPARV